MEASLCTWTELDPVESRCRKIRKTDIKAAFSLFFTKGAFLEDIKANISGFVLMLYFTIRRDSEEVSGAGSGNGGGVRFSALILHPVPVSDSAYLRCLSPESRSTAEAAIISGVPPPLAVAALTARCVSCNKAILRQVQLAGASGCALILRRRPFIAGAAGSSST